MVTQVLMTLSTSSVMKKLCKKSQNNIPGKDKLKPATGKIMSKECYYYRLGKFHSSKQVEVVTVHN